MYVLVMMVLATLMAFSVSYMFPHRDDYIHQVEPLKARGFAEEMAAKHQAAISKAAYAKDNPGYWNVTGVVETSDLKAVAPDNFLPAWFHDNDQYQTLRFCVSEEPQPTPTYTGYKGITSAPTCDGAASHHSQAIITYGNVPEKYTKRSVLTAIRKQFKGTDGEKQGIGLLNWNATLPDPHWDVFPIGGGAASELPRNIDTLITDATAEAAAALPPKTPPIAFANGQIVIYTKLGIQPEW